MKNFADINTATREYLDICRGATDFKGNVRIVVGF